MREMLERETHMKQFLSVKGGWIEKGMGQEDMHPSARPHTQCAFVKNETGREKRFSQKYSIHIHTV